MENKIFNFIFHKRRAFLKCTPINQKQHTVSCASTSLYERFLIDLQSKSISDVAFFK